MKKRIRLSLLCGLICAVLLSMTQFNVLCDDLRQNVLRLHIIANSDSAFDQQLKLKVRDEILAQTGEVFLNVEDLAVAEQVTAQNLKKFQQIAQSVIKQNGANYNVDVCLGDSFFETRHYDTFSLPAGNYRSLIIKIGEAKGKNWWCVVFPAMCIPAASGGDLRQSVDERAASVAENKDKYIIKFKTVEIYEKLKNFFS
ncbi:MAG: stage II sporulation protein R [Ruminococcaceae bacterium]|nr:stage II sporulation protein R [Oscillospiraceae bacterium]